MSKFSAFLFILFYFILFYFFKKKKNWTFIKFVAHLLAGTKEEQKH